MLCPRAPNRRGPPGTPDVSILPQRLPRECGSADTLTLDIWSPDLCKNQFLLFQASYFVALCSNDPGTTAQWPCSEVALLQGTGVCCEKQREAQAGARGVFRPGGMQEEPHFSFVTDSVTCVSRKPRGPAHGRDRSGHVGAQVAQPILTPGKSRWGNFALPVLPRFPCCPLPAVKQTQQTCWRVFG